MKEVFPDVKGNVRNVELKVMNKQDGLCRYKPSQSNYLKRHVNHLILLVLVDEEEEGLADDHLPEVSAQAVQEVHDQKDVAAPTTVQPSSASQDSSEEQSDVPGQGDDEALHQPCQVDEELGGECSRGRRKTTGLVCNATATTIIGSMGLTRAAASEL